MRIPDIDFSKFEDIRHPIRRMLLMALFACPCRAAKFASDLPPASQEP